MRLYGKLVAIIVVCLFVVLAVLVVGQWSAGRIRDYQTAQTRSTDLLIRSKRVHNQLQYLMLEIFAPEGYSLVTDVLQRPPVSLSVFEKSIHEFSEAYDAFFDNPVIQSLLIDRALKRHYEVATAVGEKAFTDLERIRLTLGTLEIEPGAPLEYRYRQMIVIGDQDQTSLMADVRYVSHYFSETFERFLDLFILRLNRNVERLQQRTLWISRSVTAIGMLLALGLVLAFAGTLTKRLKVFMRGVEALSKGEFGMSLPEGPEDELGILLRRFNVVCRELAKNIDSISELMNAVGQQISQHPEFPQIPVIIGEATLQYTNADCVSIFSRDEGGNDIPYVFRSRNPQDGNQEMVYWREFPLRTRLNPSLTMTVGTLNDHLSDLDISHLQTLSKYVALLIDHNDAYRELAERRQVAFEALQAQIHPHFLFNVLGGIFGLNRKGDRGGVERSIICLRDMLHFIIDSSETTRLSEEIEFVRQYLDLQQIRFSGSIDISVVCDPSVADVVVPRLILQPIVENAIVHGLDNTGCGNTVTVLAHEHRIGLCRVVISDDGCGFDVHRYMSVTHDVQPESHIGIPNVRRRLAIRYPSSRFRIESEIGKGTVVTLDIPFEILIKAPDEEITHARYHR